MAKETTKGKVKDLKFIKPGKVEMIRIQGESDHVLIEDIREFWKKLTEDSKKTNSKKFSRDAILTCS